MILKKKTMTSLTTMFLVLSVAASIIALLPQVNAQTVTQTRSFMYIGASPSTVGVGQEVIIVTWTADMPPDIGETAGTVASPNGRAGWNNPAIVTITKPDGSNETVSMPRTDPVGATWSIYVPEEVGTYMLQAYFPGEWKNTTTLHRYYQPDYSEPTSLTVQQDPIQNWQETPLPNDYWTRPLNSENRDWYVVAGNWLGGAATNYPIGSYGYTTTYAYGKGTETPHILWTQQYATGGLMDESYGPIGYQTAHYQGLGFSGIVVNGKIHYTPRYTAHWSKGWTSLDLYTGEQLLVDYNASAPSFGQVYNYESPNQHGGFAYLWRTSDVTLPDNITRIARDPTKPGSNAPPETVPLTSAPGTQTWEMLDALTGNRVCYIANVSGSGTSVYGKDGSILRYNLANLGSSSNPNYYLQVWNSSAIPTLLAGDDGTYYWQWRPQYGGHSNYGFRWRENVDAVHDGSTGYSLNISIPSILGERNSIQNQTGSIQAIRQDEYFIVGTTGVNDERGIVKGFLMAISLEPGKVGTILWKTEFTPPSSADAETVSFTGVYPDEGMFLFHKQKTIERFGYSLDSGQLVWTSEPETQFHYYGRSQKVYNGTLYSSGYGGIITAYDIKTGDIQWSYEPTSIGSESAYGGYYPTGVVLISDGKLYTVTGEHSPTQPLYRGPNLRCINAADGTEIWKIQGWFGGMSPTSSNILMADGILVGLNFFDNQLYAFGRGPSATTVWAESDTLMHGGQVMIKGSVTDQSAYGRRNINGVLDFSLKDSPAISDDDMAAWMEYKYMQQPIPTDAKGVEIELNAIDPNGNYIPLGTTTSDMNGNFGLSFAPEVPGDYHITATFAGSKAYGPSASSTYITVEDVQSTVTAAPMPTEAIADTYFIPAVVAILVVIIAVGIANILLQRKRP